MCCTEEPLRPSRPDRGYRLLSCSRSCPLWHSLHSVASTQFAYTARRLPYPFELGAEFARLKPLLHHVTSLPATFAQTFQGAAKFYLQALQNFEREPEVSYLHLITASEILSNFTKFDKHELLDEQTKILLETIRTQLPNGVKVANQITGSLLLIKKRFVQTITGLVDSAFFDRSESKEQFAQLKSDSFEAAIGAAYDLRSKYVHTGMPFGIWVSRLIGGSNTEIQVGEPVVSDKDFGEILARAPTLVGLERIVRYCLPPFCRGKWRIYQLNRHARARTPNLRSSRQPPASRRLAAHLKSYIFQRAPRSDTR